MLEETGDRQPDSTWYTREALRNATGCLKAAVRFLLDAKESAGT